MNSNNSIKHESFSKWYIKIVGIILIISTLFYYACSDESDQEEMIVTSNISGTIYKSGTSISVSGARVSIGNNVSTTDKEGNYLLQNIPIGKVTIYVEKTNFETFAKTFNLSANGLKNNNIEIVSLIKQKLFGKIYNSEKKPIIGAVVTIGQVKVTTDSFGNYEFLDLEGDYSITVEKKDYQLYESQFTIKEGEKELDLYLTSVVLPQVSNLNIVDKYYGINVNWPKSSSKVIKGYNIYYQEWLVHSGDVSLYGGGASVVYSEWKKANVNLIFDNQILISTEEFNSEYKVFVLPVNIDDVETPFIENGNKKTQIEKIYLYPPFKGKFLGKFSLTDLYGPINIPNTNNGEVVLSMKFEYKDDYNFFNPENWDVQVSTNKVSWTKIGSHGTKIYGNSPPTRNAGYIVNVSLNQYAGQTLYFRTTPDSFGSPKMEISNEIYEFWY